MESLDETNNIREYSLLKHFLFFRYACLHMNLSHSFFRQTFHCVQLTASLFVFH